MKWDWNSWNGGGKVILVAGCVATVSMLMTWIDLGIVSRTGLADGEFLFLAFRIYPLLMLLKNKLISRVWGLVCAIPCAAYAIYVLGDLSSTWLGRPGPGHMFSYSHRLRLLSYRQIQTTQY
jgi:hypothetical protein